MPGVGRHRSATNRGARAQRAPPRASGAGPRRPATPACAGGWALYTGGGGAPHAGAGARLRGVGGDAPRACAEPAAPVPAAPRRVQQERRGGGAWRSGRSARARGGAGLRPRMVQAYTRDQKQGGWCRWVGSRSLALGMWVHVHGRGAPPFEISCAVGLRVVVCSLFVPPAARAGRPPPAEGARRGEPGGRQPGCPRRGALPALGPSRRPSKPPSGRAGRHDGRLSPPAAPSPPLQPGNLLQKRKREKSGPLRC